MKISGYSLGRALFSRALTEFFRSIRQSGAPLVEDGPLIIVANHPNHFLDSMLILRTYKRELWFLAKSTVFRGPLRWILPKLHLIPVYRKQDSADMRKNAQTFAEAIARLHAGGGIALFPEGVSMGERRLFELKTGAARIALQAASAAPALRIQAVGLTYGSPREFRSSVTITVGEPIEVKYFSALYADEPHNAVRDLTAAIEATLRTVTVEVQSAHVALVEKIARLFELERPNSDDKTRLDIITKNVEALEQQVGARRVDLEARIDAYLQVAALFGLDAFAKVSVLPAGTLVLPVLLGAAVHWLPYQLIGKLALRLSTHPVDEASLKFGVGLVVFTVWYVIVFLLVTVWLGVIAALCVGGAMLLSGIVANRYIETVRMHLLAWLWPGVTTPPEVLRAIRLQLLSDLQALRVV